MKSFTEFTSTPTRNLHLTHLDESLFEGGDVAAQKSIDALRSIVENDDSYKLTTKWDGAPAIFCGTDPADGQFFVGTKSVFNKNPKLYKESADILANEPAGKAEKLVEALRLLPKLGIPRNTVLQGDLLWTSGDHVYETYENERYVTVHPNTLVYGWVAESDEGKAVRNAKLGIVFHTTYHGRNSLQNYQATFGANVDKLKSHSEMWVRDARFTADVDLGEDSMSLIESAQALVGSFDKIVMNENVIPSSMVGCSVKTYVNGFIREGRPLSDMSTNDYREYVSERYIEAMNKLISESAINKRKIQLRMFNEQVNVDRETYENAFEFVYLMQTIKNKILGELNDQNNQTIFVKTKDGLQETSPEGYVFIGNDGNGVKIVDRQTFSHYNFSEEYVKGWQK